MPVCPWPLARNRPRPDGPASCRRDRGLCSRNPALLFARVGRTRIAADRGAPHHARLLVGVEPGRSVHQAAIVPHHQVAWCPFVDIDELRAASGAPSVRPASAAPSPCGPGSMPTNGPSSQSIWPYSHRYSARRPVTGWTRATGWRCELLVRRQPRGVSPASTASRRGRRWADMQALERIDARLERRRQCLIGRGAVGEQRLALAVRHRQHRKEQRDIGRRAAIALVGVPALRCGNCAGSLPSAVSGGSGRRGGARGRPAAYLRP